MKEEHCLENKIFFSVSEANIFCPWHCVAIFHFCYNAIVLKGKTLFFFSKTTIFWISKSRGRGITQMEQTWNKKIF